MPEKLIVITNSIGTQSGCAQDNCDRLKEAAFKVLDSCDGPLTEEQAKMCTQDQKELSLFTDGPVSALLIEQNHGFKKFLRVAADLEHVFATSTEIETLKLQRALFPQPQRFERAVIIIKPGFAPDDHKLLREQLLYHDFTIICEKCFAFTDEQAKTLNIPDLTNGDSMVFVVDRMDCIDMCKIVSGGNEAIYTSPSLEASKQAEAVLFPDSFPLERTLALIKPNAYPEVQNIIPTIKANGFELIACDTLTLSKPRAAEFYAEHKGKSFFGNLVSFMSSGPIMALVLQKHKAIQGWRTLIGPTNSFKAKELKPNSLRAKYGADGTKNAFHGSDSVDSAMREIDFFFPALYTSKIPDSEEYTCASLKGATQPVSLQDVLTKGLTKLCQVKPVGLDSIDWLGNWLLANNPCRPAVEPSPPTKIDVDSIEMADVDDDNSDSLTLKAKIKAKKVRIVSALGPEGSRTEAVAKKICEDMGYEHISFSRMVKAAANKGDMQLSNMMQAALSRGSSCPANAAIIMLSKAIGAYLETAQSKGGTIIVSGFPQNLDQALNFAKEVTEPSFFLVFKEDETQVTAKAKAEAKKTGVSEELMDRMVRRFSEETLPVVRHYSKFQKVKEISDRGELGGVVDSTKAVM